MAKEFVERLQAKREEILSDNIFELTFPEATALAAERVITEIHSERSMELLQGMLPGIKSDKGEEIREDFILNEAQRRVNLVRGDTGTSTVYESAYNKIKEAI